MIRNPLAYLSLIIVYFVWGVTFFAILIIPATFPSSLCSAIAQLIAIVIMMETLIIIRKEQLQRSGLFHQFITEILMVTLGDGLIGWCEAYPASGFTTAKELEVKKLAHYTQSALKPTLSISKKFGVQQIPIKQGIYKRADTKMELNIKL